MWMNWFSPIFLHWNFFWLLRFNIISIRLHTHIFYFIIVWSIITHLILKLNLRRRIKVFYDITWITYVIITAVTTTARNIIIDITNNIIRLNQIIKWNTIFCGASFLINIIIIASLYFSKRFLFLICNYCTWNNLLLFIAYEFLKWRSWFHYWRFFTRISSYIIWINLL